MWQQREEQLYLLKAVFHNTQYDYDVVGLPELTVQVETATRTAMETANREAFSNFSTSPVFFSAPAAKSLAT